MKDERLHWAWICGPALLLAAGLGIGCERQPPQLLQQRVVDGHARLIGTGSARFTFSARSGQRFVARLGQFDVDATLELAAADGRKLIAQASPADRHGREYMYWMTARDGAFEIAVKPVAPAARTGRIEVEVFALPDEPDARAIQALEAMSAAAQRGTHAAPRLLQRAAGIWQKLGERALAADCTLQAAAASYHQGGDWTSAARLARSAEAAYVQLGEPKLRADARWIEAAADLELARANGRTELYEPAVATLREVRRSLIALGQPASAALTLNFLGSAAYYRGELAAAESYFHTAESESRSAGAETEGLQALRNLIMLRQDRGDSVAAARDYERLLAASAQGSEHTRAVLLQNGALALSNVGEIERALAWYRESLQLARQAGDQDLIARGYSGLGQSHARLGQFDLAVSYLQQALEINSVIGATRGIAVTLTQLGDAYRQSRRPALAVRTQQQAANTAVELGSPALSARILVGLADAQAAAGQYAAAIASYGTALRQALPEGHPMSARALIGRARSYRADGAYALAQQDLALALRSCRAAENREDYVAAMAEQAELKRTTGDLDGALIAVGQARAEVDRLRSYTVNPDNRISLTARLRTVVELQVQLLIDSAQRERRRGQQSAARRLAYEAMLAADEPAAAALWQPRSKSAATNDRLQRTLDELAERRNRLIALMDRNAGPAGTTRALEREIAALRSELALLGYAGLSPATPRSGTMAHGLPALQSRVPLGATLLVHFVGPARGWQWIITREGFEWRELAPSAELDRLVKVLLLEVRRIASGGAVAQAATRLADALLPAAAARQPGHRLLVIPDGSLGAVPWSLLGAAQRPVDALLLSSVHELLAADAFTLRVRRGGSALRLALFGDPIFDTTEAAGMERTAVPPVRMDPALPRLPGTAAEVRQIASLAAPGASNIALGARATRDAVLALDPSDVDVLHLATHARLDTEVPQLAALVFSRFGADGRALAAELRSHDIVGLRAQPWLVVLSACDAAAEPARNARGLVNLTRAFLAARARYVLSSLWPVSDAGAIELMTAFYRGVLEQGQDPATALGMAQRHMAQSTRWRAPFYWAGFVVTAIGP